MRQFDHKVVANDDVDKRLNCQEAAVYLGMAVATLNKWRCHGDGPIFLKVGRLIRYRKSDLDQFLSDCERRSTSQLSS